MLAHTACARCALTEEATGRLRTAELAGADTPLLVEGPLHAAALWDRDHIGLRGHQPPALPAAVQRLLQWHAQDPLTPCYMPHQSGVWILLRWSW